MRKCERNQFKNRKKSLCLCPSNRQTKESGAAMNQQLRFQEYLVLQRKGRLVPMWSESQRSPRLQTDPCWPQSCQTVTVNWCHSPEAHRILSSRVREKSPASKTQQKLTKIPNSRCLTEKNMKVDVSQ